MEDAPGFLSSLLDYHYGLLYEGLAEDQVKEKQLTRAMHDWRAISERDPE